MQATIKAKDLQSALDILSKCVFTGSSVLTNQLLLSADTSTLSIQYAAFDAAMFLSISAENISKGEVSIAYDKFYDIVSAISADISISLTSSTQLSIGAGKHKIKLPIAQNILTPFIRSTAATWYDTAELLDVIARAATFTNNNVVIDNNTVIGTDGLVFASYGFKDTSAISGGISQQLCKKLKKLSNVISSMAATHSTYDFKLSGTDQLIARKVTPDQRLAPLITKLKEIADPIAPLSIDRKKLSELLNISSKLSESATIKIDKTSLSVSTENETYSGSFDMAGTDTDITFKCNAKDVSNVVNDISADTFELRTTSEDTVPVVIYDNSNMYVTTKIV